MGQAPNYTADRMLVGMYEGLCWPGPSIRPDGLLGILGPCQLAEVDYVWHDWHMRVGAFEISEPAPELHDTLAFALLRSWVDVGRVGTLVLSKLEQHFGANEVARLARPGVFFDFTRDRPRVHVIEGRRVLDIPNSIVRYAHDSETGRDHLFLHLREPHAMSEDYTDSVVTLLKHFEVTEYCRVGGMYDSVPHTRPLLVTGSLSTAQAEQAEGLFSPRKSTYQGPTSIVNLVNDQLEDSGIRTTSLMVHLPSYAQLNEDHLGAHRLSQVLSAAYGFPDSLVDSERGQEQYTGISRMVENNPEVKGVIQRLEVEYDRLQVSLEPEEKVSLPPELEKFLREVGGRLENQQEDE